MAYAFGHARIVPKTATRDVPCQPAETALIIMDAQDFFCLPGRGCNVDKTRTDMPYFFDRVEKVMKPNIKQLLDQARSAGLEIVYVVTEALTRDGRDVSLHYKLNSNLFVPKGHQDAKVLSEIAPISNEIVIQKSSSSVFGSTNISYVLRNLGVRYLLVCGQCTNGGVESAVRSAADEGFLVTLLEDACVAKSSKEHEVALNSLKGFARVLTTSSVISEFRTKGTSSPQDIKPALSSSTPDMQIRFLPTTVTGKRVLIPLGRNRFRVSNSEIKAQSEGLGYRVSKDPEDRDPDKRCAAWNSTIEGIDDGSGWIQVQVSMTKSEALDSEKVFNAIDANHDGVITKSEFSRTSASRPNITAGKGFDDIDKNRDGVITKSELKSALADRKAAQANDQKPEKAPAKDVADSSQKASASTLGSRKETVAEDASAGPKGGLSKYNELKEKMKHKHHLQEEAVRKQLSNHAWL